MNSDGQVSLNVTRKKYPRVLSRGGRLSTTVTTAFKRWCCAEGEPRKVSPVHDHFMENRNLKLIFAQSKGF